MELRTYGPSEAKAIEDLFVSVFTESGGEQEGALIGSLVRELMASTANRDVYGFVAVDAERVVGAVFFTRLTFERDTVDAFLLSPVAVRSEYQGGGTGKALITHGLGELKKDGVQVVTTYGDPDFYSRVGFTLLSQDVVQAPHPLSQPEGWLGLSLTGDAIEPMPGPCSCVQALDHPDYW